MSLSTMTFPDGNHSGFDNAERLAVEARYGLVTFGWEMRICLTAVPSTPRSSCTHAGAEWSLDENARRLKAINPKTRVFLYRNTELALSPYVDQCAKMYDPSYAGYFLQDRNGKVLNDPATAGEFQPCDAPANASALVQDQFFTDFRNASASAWFVDTVVGRVANSTNADGVWFDDASGVGAEHPDVTKNFSPAQLAAIRAATRDALDLAQQKLADAGKYSFNGGGPNSFAAMPLVQPGPRCASTMKALAALGASNVPALMAVPYGAPPLSEACATGPAGAAAEGETLSLRCAPGSGVMTAVELATFGTPVVNRTGRFVSTTTGPDAGKVFWEDVSAKTLYYVAAWNDDCAVCEGCSTLGCCTAYVNASAIASMRKAAEDFGCGVLQAPCEDLRSDPACSADVAAQVGRLCVGKAACDVLATAQSLSVADPCPSVNRTAKHLAVRASGCACGPPPTTAGDFQQHLAAFLVARGDYNWFGHSWISTRPPVWYPEWSVDYGVPLEPMRVSPNGTTFSRRWSKGTVTLDCDAWSASFLGF